LLFGKSKKEAIDNNYFYAIEYDKIKDKFKMKKSDKLTKKRLMIKK
jgi:hypothetical protein